MPLEDIFPITIFKDYIDDIDNSELIKACEEIKELDIEGRATCPRKFPFGYTSYYTIDDIHIRLKDEEENPVYSKFSLLISEILKRAQFYADELLADNGLNQQMMHKEGATQGLDHRKEVWIQSCWVNITEQYNYHDIHNHANSFISGIYYLNDVSSLTLYSLNQYKQEVMTYESREGLVLLWPGWLYHQANQIIKKETKYGITFNIGCDVWGSATKEEKEKNETI